MKSDSKKELAELAASLPRTRAYFEMAVEATALEVTNIAQQISGAIGEISVDEAKQAIIKEFTKRLMS